MLPNGRMKAGKDRDIAIGPRSFGQMARANGSLMECGVATKEIPSGLAYQQSFAWMARFSGASMVSSTAMILIQKQD
jgi:hypothetical protein